VIGETAQSLNALGPARKSRSMQWPEAEFEAVFLEHYGRIVSVLLRLLGDRTRAEELANANPLNFSPFSSASLPSSTMVVYAGAYTALALLFAIRRFSRRDL
jgi:hypothetical protein